MVFIYWCSNYFGNYAWKLNIKRVVVIVTRKERKYNLTSPFWLVTVVEKFCWVLIISFGRIFSSQIKSSNRVADFWPIVKFVKGLRRCMVSGKYPNIVENLNVVEGCLYFRFWVK